MQEVTIDELAKKEGHEQPPFQVHIIECDNLYIYWKDGTLYIQGLKCKKQKLL